MLQGLVTHGGDGTSNLAEAHTPKSKNQKAMGSRRRREVLQVSCLCIRLSLLFCSCDLQLLVRSIEKVGNGERDFVVCSVVSCIMQLTLDPDFDWLEGYRVRECKREFP